MSSGSLRYFAWSQPSLCLWINSNWRGLSTWYLCVQIGAKSDLLDKHAWINIYLCTLPSRLEIRLLLFAYLNCQRSVNCSVIHINNALFTQKEEDSGRCQKICNFSSGSSALQEYVRDLRRGACKICFALVKFRFQLAAFLYLLTLKQITQNIGRVMKA